MKTEMPELINNEAKKRYEIHFEDSVAFIEYIKTKENIYLTHTEVPKKLEGQRHWLGNGLGNFEGCER